MVVCGTRAAVGGTFDKFHRGHRKFLSTALDGSEELVIGITSDEFAMASKDHPVEPFEIRLENVKRFVQKKGRGKKVEIVKLEDPYGPTVEDEKLEVLFVTASTKCRGEEINFRRVKNGLKPLKIVEVPMELAEDGEPISTSRIRDQVIDSEGRLLRKTKG